MLTQRNIRPSLQCFPLALKACGQESHSHPHTCTRDIYMIFTDMLQPCLCFYLLNISLPSLCRTVRLHIRFVCVHFHMQSQGFLSLLTPQSPANSVSMETGAGEGGDDVDFLTPSVPWDTNCQQVHMFVCLCACVNVYAYFHMINMMYICDLHEPENLKVQEATITFQIQAISALTLCRIVSMCVSMCVCVCVCEYSLACAASTFMAASYQLPKLSGSVC